MNEPIKWRIHQNRPIRSCFLFPYNPRHHRFHSGDWRWWPPDRCSTLSICLWNRWRCHHTKYRYWYDLWPHWLRQSYHQCWLPHCCRRECSSHLHSWDRQSGLFWTNTQPTTPRREQSTYITENINFANHVSTFPIVEANESISTNTQEMTAIDLLYTEGTAECECSLKVGVQLDGWVILWSRGRL